MKGLITSLLLTVQGLTSHPVEIKSKDIGLHINTGKVSYLTSNFDDGLAQDYIDSVKRTMFMPGERVIIINSNGGMLTSGQKILDLMHMEQAMGTKIVCVVMDKAHSMGFNVLSHCDVKLASPHSKMLVHKARVQVFWTVIRASDAYRLYKDLMQADEPFRQKNALEMHLTLKEYDIYAELETVWTAQQLKDMGYLDGFIEE